MIKIDNWSLWPLNDGYLEFDQKSLFASDIDQYLGAGERLHMEVYGYLVDTGKDLILIDTGGGSQGGATVGHLKSHLLRTGHNENSISLILLTHLDWDHIGGLLAPDVSAAFPNATLCVCAAEVAYWRGETIKATKRRWASLAQSVLALYKDRLRLIEPGESIIPGVMSLAAYGHTPGHLAFLFQQKLLLWGDVVYGEEVQFADPMKERSIIDVDAAQAALTRCNLMEKGADQNWLVGGAHLSGSGLGRIQKKGNHFVWTRWMKEQGNHP